MAGPLAGLILADLGADVIKIEEPDGGDQARRMPGAAPSTLFFNRNKRSFAVDLRRPRARRSSAPGRDRRHRARQLRARRARPARAWATRAGGDQPAAHLLSVKGFLPGPLRAAPVARRAGADDGRAGLHDRPARPAAARRRLDRRHRRRHLRRDRRAGRAARARRDRPRPDDHLGPVRDDGVLGRAVDRLGRATGQASTPMSRSASRSAWAGASSSCSRRPTTRRCSSASPRTPTGSASARSSSWPTCWPTRGWTATRSAWRRASGCCRGGGGAAPLPQRRAAGKAGARRACPTRR